MLAYLCKAQHAIPFQNCRDDLTVTIQQVIIDEQYVDDTPLITFTAIGTTSATISGGRGVTRANILGISVYSDTSNLCLIVGGCPRGPGTLQVSSQIKIEKLRGLWGVDLNGRMEWYDETDQLIGCVEAQFAIMEAGGMDTLANAIIMTVAMGACVVAVAASGVLYVMSAQGTVATGSTSSGGAFPSPVVPSMVDFVLYLQFLSQTGVLNLDYPQSYQQIISKFGWANFIPNMDFLKNITLGVRNGLPYEQPQIPQSPLADPKFEFGTDFGFSGYSRLIGLSPHDIFLYMTVVLAFVVVIWTAIALFIRMIIELAIYLGCKYRDTSPIADSIYHSLRHMGLESRRDYMTFYVGNLVRIFYLSYFALVATSIFQFTLKGDHWAIYLWAAIVLAGFCVGLVIFFTVYLLRYRHRPSLLYTDRKKYMLFGALYNNYAELAYSFFIVFLVYRMLAGIVIGGVYPSPLTQMILLFIVEVGYLWILGARRPLNSKFNQNLHVAASILRVIATGLLMAFLPGLVIDRNVKGIIGYGILGLNVIAILIYAAVMIRALALAIKECKQKRREARSVSRTSIHDLVSFEDLKLPPEVVQPEHRVLPNQIDVVQDDEYIDSIIPTWSMERPKKESDSDQDYTIMN